VCIRQGVGGAKEKHLEKSNEEGQHNRPEKKKKASQQPIVSKKPVAS